MSINLNNLVIRFNNLTRMIDSRKDYLMFNKLSTERSGILKQIQEHPDFDQTQRYFLLPKIKPDIYVSSSIAIVGNSVTLLNHNFGTEIDNHTDVIRFNYAHTKGYEPHCGSKTTIYVAGYPAFLGGKPKAHPVIDNMDYQYYQKLKSSNVVVYYRGENVYNQCKKMAVQVRKNNNQIFFFNLDGQTHYNNVLKSKEINSLKAHLQSGSLLMMLMVDLGLKPNLYGFDLKYCDDNFYYYWDLKHKKCLQLSRFHNYDDEFFIPNKLNELGLINIKTTHKV
jgi:hypothetical protein